MRSTVLLLFALLMSMSAAAAAAGTGAGTSPLLRNNKNNENHSLSDSNDPANFELIFNDGESDMWEGAVEQVMFNMELHWMKHEMERYKNARGSYPTRNSLSSNKLTHDEDSIVDLLPSSAAVNDDRFPVGDSNLRAVRDP